VLRQLEPRTAADWDQALSWRAQLGSDVRVTQAVAAIIEDVRSRGDAAVHAAAAKFDQVPFGPDRFRVSETEWNSLANACPKPVVAALELSARRIESFHRAHRPQATRVSDNGATLEQRIVPLGAVLCYAPGGRASYPSTVLMTAIPGRVAGVGRVCVTSPARGGQDISPAIAAAARIAGAHELWRVGGVQAVAAFALGTQTTGRVDKVVGPGNAFVTEAKRQLSSEVGIDSLAGPTEVLIVAEEGAAPARWIACDLIAQAEHDPEARSVLVTSSARLVDEVEQALAQESIGDVALRSLESHGCAIISQSLDESLAFANRYAPEHLELVLRDPLPYVDRVRTAGAVFLGAYAPVPVGDYLAGPNHTLPTAGTARFASGLSTHDFVRRQSVISYDAARLRADVAALRALADAEGLPAHARAAEVRFE
jgi:histidinol dehydrogenase